MMTNTQARKVKNKLKDETFGPIPEYADWEKAEVKAIDHCLMNIKVLDGMGNIPLNFGHNYKRALKVIDFHQPVYLIETDKGTIRVEVAHMAIQKKSWWERHFCGSRNNEITVAYQLKGTREIKGEHYELYKWTAYTNISNVVEFVEFTAYQERDFAETIYRHGGVEVK